MSDFQGVCCNLCHRGKEDFLYICNDCDDSRCEKIKKLEIDNKVLEAEKKDFEMRLHNKEIANDIILGEIKKLQEQLKDANKVINNICDLDKLDYQNKLDYLEKYKGCE